MTAEKPQVNPRLVDEFSSVLSEAEDMLKRAANETGENAKDLRSQVEAKLLTAKLRLQEFEDQATDRAKEAARATDDYVHEHPWYAISIAAAAGALVGSFVTRIVLSRRLPGDPITPAPPPERTSTPPPTRRRHTRDM